MKEAQLHLIVGYWESMGEEGHGGVRVPDSLLERHERVPVAETRLFVHTAMEDTLELSPSRRDSAFQAHVRPGAAASVGFLSLRRRGDPNPGCDRPA